MGAPMEETRMPNRAIERPTVTDFGEFLSVWAGAHRLHRAAQERRSLPETIGEALLTTNHVFATRRRSFMARGARKSWFVEGNEGRSCWSTSAPICPSQFGRAIRAIA